MSGPPCVPLDRLRVLVTARWGFLAAALTCAISGWPAVSTAQTYYKWTDSRGVVHFSDQAPVQEKGVEERQLAPVPPAPEGTESSTEPAGNDTEGNNPKKTDDGSSAGPAQVVVVSQQSPHTGPSEMHIHGKVKNVGGKDAQRVAVTISAVDSQQGNPCLQNEIPVTPSTLHPGETGKFDTHLDNPCLFGDAKVDIGPVWE